MSWRDRVAVAPRATALAWLAGVGLVLVLLGSHLIHRGSHASAVSAAAPVAAAPLPSAAAAMLVVDVGGKVRRPGLVRVAAGSRVADAIAAAGGALHPSDLATVNLAAKVTDGQLLLVGVPGAGVGSASGASGPLDINAATADQLDALPGVGPVLAQRIVDWRTQHGGFRSVDDLQQVPGIGARKFADLKALVTA